MADRTQRLAIVVTAQDLAAGKLKNVRSELAQMGTAGKLASVGLGGVMLVGNKAGQALGNLKNRLTSLAGPLGLIGLSAGALTLTGAFEKGISKATEWGLAIEKLTGLTNNSAEQLSGLLGITEKYGISNERITQIAGFTEKALGKLEMTTVKGAKATKSAALQHLELVKAQRQAAGESTKVINKLISEQKGRDAVTAAQAGQAAGQTKLTALAKQYGIVLTNSKGQALDFQSVLLNVADAYSRAKTAADKAKMAALSAALFGRGYADLIPILKLGRKGILDAEQAAKDLGLTLTTQNVADLAKYREAMREASDATSGLELQAGLLVMPDLTTAFKSYVEFMRTHQADAKAFFTGVLHTAEGVVSFVTGTVVPTISGLASVATGFWNSIPGPLRDFMVKGIVADRTIKFLFGMSPIHLVASLAEGAIAKSLGGAAGGFFGKGTLGNPMIVKDIGGGLGGAPGAATGGLGLISKVFLVGEAIGLAVLVNDVRQSISDSNTKTSQALVDKTSTWLGQQPSKADLQKGLAGVEGAIKELQTSNLPYFLVQGDALDNLKKMRVELQQSLAEANGQRLTGNLGRSAPMGGVVLALDKTASTLTVLQQQLHADFRDAIGALRKATDPAAIIAAAKRVTADTLSGVGSGKTTKATIADLSAKRDVLLAAGDKTNAAIISAEIRKLSPLIAGREHQAALLAQGRKIVASSESAKQKVGELKGIEQTLLSEHRTSAAAAIQKQIDIINAINLTTSAVTGISIPAYTGSGQTGTHHAPGTGPTKGDSGSTGAKPSLSGEHYGGKAAGGPTLAHHAYRVGEKGDETLVMGDLGGFVIPHGYQDSGPRTTQFMAPDGSMWPSKQAYMNWRTGRVSTIGDFGRHGPMRHAAGLLGMTKGLTNLGALGVAGEVQNEAVAIVRHPKALTASAGGSKVFVTNWPTTMAGPASGSSGAGAGSTSGKGAVGPSAPTTADQLKAALKAIDTRAVAKGFHPTAALDRGTYDRDIARGFSIDRILRLLPGTQVNVNMSAADVQKARVVRSRIVKPHGSRGSLVGVGT